MCPAPTLIRKGSLLWLALILVSLSACTGSDDVKHRTWIDFPQQSAQFHPGDVVPITAHYYAEEQVGRAAIMVDGQSVKEVPSPGEAKPVGEISQDWVPDHPGVYRISVAIYSQAEALLSRAEVEVQVLEEQKASPGVLTENGFCRQGPGTVYPALAIFEEGYQVSLEARSETLSPLWWYVADPSSGIQCWISDAVLAVEVDPQNLLAREAPPLPEPVGEAGQKSGSEGATCRKDLNPSQCIAAGGTWYTPLKLSAEPYCQCPQ